MTKHSLTGVLPTITRREFVASAASAIVALPLSLRPDQPNTYQLGCYTRPWDKFDYRVAFDGIAGAGYRYAGLMTAKGKSWVIINTDTTPDEVMAIANEAKARSLKVLSIYGGEFPVAKSLEAGITGLKTLIDHCSLCGCPNLLLGGTADVSLNQAYYKVVKECAPYAAAKNIGLSIKPHGGTNATGAQCRRIIEDLDQPNFRLWYDPGNIFYYSEGKLDPVEDSLAVHGLLAGMSVKDFLPPKEVLLTPGTGKVRFREVFSNLRQGGFTQGPVLVECVAAMATPQQITAEARKARLFVETVIG